MNQAMKMMMLVLAAVVLLTACGEKPAAKETAATTTEAVTTTTEAVTQPTDHDNTEIVDNGDGTSSCFTYNENGEIVRIELLDENGVVVEETLYDRAYDDNGKLLRELVIIDAVVVSEDIYAYSTEAEGETYLHESIWYREDGSKEVTTYEEVGDNYKRTEYDADGQMVSATEFLYDEDENTVIEYGADGNVVSKEVTIVDGDAVSTVYYDGDGNVTSKEVSVIHDDGSTTTTYDADDNVVKKEEYTYTDEGMFLTVYDGDGNVISSEKFDFEAEDQW